jgi:RHS repeat-associated protein
MKIQNAKLLAFLVLTSIPAYSADFGRTAGSFGVDSVGAATYSIPIWAPPGPRGLQPAISLNYSSTLERGDVGVGWMMSGLGSIERCERTAGHDVTPDPILLTMADRYCMNGSRLRLVTGTYGQSGSTYQTQYAEFSLVTAFGTEGNGPQYFEVKAKNGLIYEYGNSTDSRIKPGTSTTVLRWMLNKVRDRNGNNYIVKYRANEGGGAGFTGFGLPESVEWTPTALGANTYQHKAEFEYEADLTKNAFYGFVAAQPLVNKYRLKEIRIKSNGDLFRRYKPTYLPGPSTGTSRMTELWECTTSDLTNCLLPLVFDYQAGQVGVTAGTGSIPSGSSNGLVKGRYDFNGDGKDDLFYTNGTTYQVAFGANSGFSSAYSTGISGSTGFNILIDRFLPGGRDAIATSVAGVLWIYRWNDATSAFVGHNTGISETVDISFDFTADHDGDGLADLITNSTSSLTVRRNTSTGSTNPSFSSTTSSTASLTAYGASARYAYVKNYFGNGLRKADMNGDGRQEVYSVILINLYNPQGQQIGVASYNVPLQGSSTGFTVPAQPWISGPGIDSPTIDFNSDSCTDRQAGTTIYISACSGTAASTITAPATPLLVLDWDGDGKTDILVNSGGNFAAYLSTGNGFSASQIATTVSSTGIYFAIDQDADNLEDLVKVNGTSAITYWTHTAGGAVSGYATQLPDLLTKVTDGLEAITEINYTSTGQSNYSPGTPPTYALQESDPRTIVAMVRSTTGILNLDGSPNKYDRTYHYTGRRYDASTKEDRKFEKISVTDSRDLTVRSTTYGQVYPDNGRVLLEEHRQSDGKLISSRAFHYTSVTLDSTSGNGRYFIYADTVTSKKYEVSLAYSGAKNGAQITESVTTYTNVDAVNGNFGTITETVTDKDTISPASPTANRAWVTTTTNVYAPNTANWCLGIPTSVTVSRSSTGLSTVTRQTDTVPNYVKCRPTQITTEPTNTKYKVKTDLEYDDDIAGAPDFGNLTKVTVTGVTTVSGVLTDMPARVTSTTWTSATGLFPVSIVNAEGEVTSFDYDYDLGVKTSETDPNGLQTVFVPDAFGRIKEVNRPDNTDATHSIASCTVGGYCPGTIKTRVIDEMKGPNGAAIAVTTTYLDSFDRPVEQHSRTMSGDNSLVRVEYDSLGRVKRQSMPCIAGAGCSTTYWTTFTYDLLGRPTTSVRDLTAGTATTSIEYSGRTTKTTDPNLHNKTVAYDPYGLLRLTTDAAGYSVSTAYDAGGNKVSVTDSQSNTLWSATYEYPVAGFATTITDTDLGLWQFLKNSLGEQIYWKDAKNQEFIAQYDDLSRITRRDDPDLISQWTWGTGTIGGTPSYDAGKLRKVTAGAYEEEFTYDTFSRLKIQKITADNAYYYDYRYDDSGTGLLDSIEYPTSTSGYRFKLKHTYQNGVLKQLSDFNSSTVFWTANTTNAFAQYTQETLGNGIVSTHGFNAATAMPSSITAVLGANTLQNENYLFDAVGNMTQRQSQRGSLSLSENAYYDAVDRLDSTTLITNGGAPVTNYEMDFDSMGRLTRWRLDGATSNNVGYTTTNPLCIDYGSQKVHAMRTTVQGSWNGFSCYDQNGNTTASGVNGVISMTYSWTSFNQPLTITNGSSANASTFYYDANHQRWKQSATYGGVSEVTRYVGPLMEEVTKPTGTSYRHYIPAGNSTVIYTRASTNSTYYITKDHLGSPSVITDAAGTLVANASFPAMGSFYRGDSWTGGASGPQMTAIANVTRRGFTGHEMMGNVFAVNMNGRSYAGNTFLSPDPYLNEPTNTQNYNRYSYVYGNPLSSTDPSGFWASSGPDYSQYNEAMAAVAQMQEVIVSAFRCDAQCKMWGLLDAATVATLIRVVIQTEGLRTGPASEPGEEKNANGGDSPANTGCPAAQPSASSIENAGNPGELNPTKILAAAATGYNGVRLTVSGIGKIAGGALAEGTGVGAVPGAAALGLGMYQLMVAAPNTFAKSMMLMDEGLNETWSDASLRNFAGALPLGNRFDDPGEPGPADVFKSSSASCIFHAVMEFSP